MPPYTQVLLSKYKFAYDDTSSIVDNFRELAISQNWKKKSKPYKEQRKQFIGEIVVDQFWEHFGGRQESLQMWKELCALVIEDYESRSAPTSIHECKSMLTGTYVNIVDLVETKRAGQSKVKPIFKSAKDLRRYILRSNKIFPKEKAKKNPLLQMFLIEVFGPGGGGGGGKRKRKAKKAAEA
ncbi:hypothetical protein DL96DRAFT_119682 [Flagelloscypha sp. PMI_526]|nr:hypothetical protein DL96DRAFT_119682 [Flagelloscypha sp. PMI_526]